MLQIEHKVREVAGLAGGPLPEEILHSPEPVVLRGLAADWPAVQAARHSDHDAVDYLRQYYRDATIGAFVGAPETRGRIFYNEDFSGFNYQPMKAKLTDILDAILRHREDSRPPAFYVGSTTVDTCLPGFREHNDLCFEGARPLASIWLGNRTRVAAHFDVPDNVACCVAGRRRFTVFPPDQLKNLYVGPLDFTPAGQAISLVDFEQPDFERFPRFREALAQARVSELEPGDAIFIPSMWWHHVEALDSLNVLVNYWWRQSPEFMGSPANVLDHALLGLRDLPTGQRKAWQELFRFYVFEFDRAEVDHIPEDRKGVLSPLDDTGARQLRARLLNRLNR